jgi:hypothetical protein
MRFTGGATFAVACISAEPARHRLSVLSVKQRLRRCTGVATLQSKDAGRQTHAAAPKNHCFGAETNRLCNRSGLQKIRK